MKSLRTTLLGLACLVACATGASASARLLSVTGAPGACALGPNGQSVQFWEVEPGKTYTLRIIDVTDCANGGTAPSFGVRLNSSSAGNTDWIANFVSEGVYDVEVTIPATAVCTMPIFYCTTPGVSNTGMFVRSHLDEHFQAHLRMATFAGPGCTNPSAVGGGECQATPARSHTWAQVKRFYR